MLVAQGLCVRRAGREVLSAIDLSLQPGEVFGVLGPNGAGKSTLLGALCGELPAYAGCVSLHGRALRDWEGAARARQLAVLPQQSGLGFAFRVEDVVGMGRLPHASGHQADADIVGQALQAVDASYLLGRNYLSLSGGERQRVHLARVFAQLWPGEAGQVLLLDEPTAALDPLHQHSILQAAAGIAARGVAVLVILHDLNLAARYCDRLLLLEGGRASRLGTTAQVLEPEAIRAVFGLDVLVQRHPEREHPLVVVR